MKKPIRRSDVKEEDAALGTPAAKIDNLTGDPDFMTSLARGLAVIEAFSTFKTPTTISQISRATGILRGSVRRSLYTLVKLGFVGCDDTCHFYLRPRVMALGYSYISSMPLPAAAQPILRNLGQRLRESCSLALWDGTEVIYIARQTVTRAMSINISVGQRLPAYCTSTGRVLLADLSSEQLELTLARIPLIPYTEQTITSVEMLREDLRLVRQNGYSIIDQELEVGIRALAVPVREPNGKVTAALNVSAPASRVSIGDLRCRFLPHLKACADEITMLLR